MENPFIYGSVVTGEYFVDREDEIRELKASLISGQHILLISPRKMGKSSLIEETFRRINGSAIALRIDMWKTPNIDAFAKEIVNQLISSSYTSTEKLLHDLGDIFKRIRPRVYVQADRVGVEFDLADKKMLLEEAMELPERIAAKKGKRVIIAFDEFQEISRFDGLETEKFLRSVIQTQKSTAYVFSGSEQSMLSLMFGDATRPFYRFARVMKLEPIKESLLIEFINSRFKKGGKVIDAEAAKWVTAFSEGIPSYVQQICHEVWNLNSIVDMNVIKKAMDNVLRTMDSGFRTIWEYISSNEQRMLLIGLSKEEAAKIYSNEFIKKYNLKSPGHVRKAVKLLEKARLVENNRISDLFFREWLRRMY